MAQLVTITVDELERIKGRITKAQQQIINYATEDLRDYGRVLRAKIAEEAPKKTGVLASTVRINTRQAGTKNVHLEVTMGNKSRPEVVVKSVLFGSKRHVIVPRKAKVLRFVSSGGGVVFAKRVNHPGTRPNNFLERALAATKPDRVGKRVTLRVAEKITSGKG
jgi:hypothetical protein